MDLGLEGKRVLVSAASKGIGRACMHRLLEEGAEIAFFARGEEAIARTIDHLGKIGAISGDVVDASDYDAVTRWVDMAAARLGGVDIVVNNASASGKNEWSRQSYVENFDVDLMSCVAMTQAAHPHFLQAGGGAIVQIATISALEHHDMPICPSYGAMKAAVINMTMQLAQRWGGDNIRANCVSPGPIEFPGGIWEALKPRREREYARDVAQHPLKRMGTDYEVADVVTFLASPRAGWVNGANVVVDGGYTKRVGY